MTDSTYNFQTIGVSVMQRWVPARAAATAAAAGGAGASHAIANECPTCKLTHSQAGDLTLLEDDCKLLGAMLDDCLKVEVGESLFKKVRRYARRCPG